MMDIDSIRFSIIMILAYCVVQHRAANFIDHRFMAAGDGQQQQRDYPVDDAQRSRNSGGASDSKRPTADGGFDDVDNVGGRYQNRPPPLYRPYQRWLQSPDEFNINAMDVSPTADVDANDYDTDANRELENMPFGVQNARSVLPARPTRNRPSSSPSSSSSAAGVQFLTTPPSSRITFQSLCPTRRETVFLNLDQSDFEYRPNHYDEVYCVHPYSNHRTYVPLSNKVCGDVGFNCIQLNRTIFLTRKAAGTGCWESETRLIPAGCECMWPKHHFGDIGGHH